jgi:hypothetical protein
VEDNMRQKWGEIFKRIKTYVEAGLRQFKIKMCNIVRNSYGRCRNGEENLKILLIYWCLVPIGIYFFVFVYFKSCRFCSYILNLFMCFLTLLDLFFIQKTLQKHPEYDSSLLADEEKNKYYASLSTEELKSIKETERRRKPKDLLKKLLFLESKGQVDAYKMVRLLLLLVLLISLKKVVFGL